MLCSERSGGAWDVVVVGAGMMGSAAAYHASLVPDTTVCLVGPAEPQDREQEKVFGCWWDEGRICCKVQAKHTWSTLARESIRRYPHTQRATGHQYYTESGFLECTTTIEDFEALKCMSENTGAGAVDATGIWQKDLPFLNLPEDAFVIWEKKDAGHLSARGQVWAHQRGVAGRGGGLVRGVVTQVLPSHDQPYQWCVVTADNIRLKCRRVLVASGGFAGLTPGLFHHVRPGYVPDLDLRTQTVAYLKVPEEEAKRLIDMPTLVTSYQFEDLDGTYVLPPIRYPDGHWYLKLGHGRVFERHVRTAEEAREWYVRERGVQACVDQLARFMHHLLPGLKVEGVTGDGCLTAHTPAEEPYVDMIAPGFGVCLGGNGYGAQASDELGRLAARLLLLGEWVSDVPQDRLRIKWRKLQDEAQCVDVRDTT